LYFNIIIITYYYAWTLQSGTIPFKQYSGYVNVNETNGRYLFYWFAESQSNPSTDPVVLWLNGNVTLQPQNNAFFADLTNLMFLSKKTKNRWSWLQQCIGSPNWTWSIYFTKGWQDFDFQPLLLEQSCKYGTQNYKNNKNKINNF